MGQIMAVSVERIVLILPFGKPHVHRVGLMGIAEEDGDSFLQQLQVDRAFTSVSWVRERATLRLVVSGSLRLSEVAGLFSVIYDLIWTLTLPLPARELCASAGSFD